MTHSIADTTVFMTSAAVAAITDGGWANTTTAVPTGESSVEVESIFSTVQLDGGLVSNTHYYRLPDGSLHQGWAARNETPAEYYSKGCYYCGCQNLHKGACAQCGDS